MELIALASKAKLIALFSALPAPRLLSTYITAHAKTEVSMKVMALWPEVLELLPSSLLDPL